MNVWLIVLGVVFLATIILLNTNLFGKKVDQRKVYLPALAKFLEAKLEPIPGQENSYEIRFVYDGRPFVYQDIEDRLGKSCIYKVYLRAATSSNLKIDFIERDRTSIRADVQTLDDMKNPWARAAEKVVLPRELQDLTVFTNDHSKANELFANEKIVKIFSQFKNSSLGRPSISLTVGNGFVVLAFHPPGDSKPTWNDLYYNASLIEDYLKQVNLVAEAVDALEKK